MGSRSFFGKDERGHAVGQQRAAVRSASAGCSRIVAGSSGGGPCARLKTASKLRDGCSDWMRQHRQVLRHVVAEDRTEDPDVVAAAVAHAQHGVVGDAVGDAEARRERRERAFDVEIETDALAAGDQHLASVDVDEAAFARAGHGLRDDRSPSAVRS